MQTRAYVHGDVSRHAVLPVLACGEIVMSVRAAGPPRDGSCDSDRSLTAFEKTAYDEMARGHFPLVLVRKMYDPDLVVVKVFPAGKDGDHYVDAREAAAAAERRPGGRPRAGRDRLVRLRPGQGIRPLPAGPAEYAGRRPRRLQAAAVERLPVAGPDRGLSWSSPTAT